VTKLSALRSNRTIAGSIIFSFFLGVLLSRKKLWSFGSASNSLFPNKESYIKDPGSNDSRSDKSLEIDILSDSMPEILPTGYQTIIAIIQGVALGILINAAAPLILKPASLSSRIENVGQLASALSSIVIVSYEYLWFTPIMRWAPRFLDCLIPYVLGIFETVPILLMNKSSQWWMAMAVFLAISAGAFGRSYFRYSKEIFNNNDNEFQEIRRLLRKLIGSCILLMFISIVFSILISRSIAPQGVIIIMPFLTSLVGTLAVWFTERYLRKFYKNSERVYSRGLGSVT
jgi:hypothetical protein